MILTDIQWERDWFLGDTDIGSENMEGNVDPLEARTVPTPDLCYLEHGVRTLKFSLPDFLEHRICRRYGSV